MFTLIELLVVIAIIGVLASLLLPALTTAKDKAKEITCGSQQKQLLTDVLLYATDYDGVLPQSYSQTHWWTYVSQMAISGHLKYGGELHCPSNAVTILQGMGDKGVFHTNYAYNSGRLGHWYSREYYPDGEDLFKRVSQVRTPSQCPALYDAPYRWTGGGALAGHHVGCAGLTYPFYDGMFTSPDLYFETRFAYLPRYSTWDIHSQRLSMSFLDGHWRAIPRKQVADKDSIWGTGISASWNGHDHANDIFESQIDE